ADCGLPQLLIGQAIIPVIGCIRIGVIERPELVIGKCLIRSGVKFGRKSALSEEQQKQVLKKLNNGGTVYALAKEYEVSRQTIMRLRDKS
ncbi:MAG: helix-turn-helix domain-containing protein, partial [Pseudomonadota bacterium]|nr:helix-turn-helix domain-containing protein [Pseudomonadota bacterium]